MIASNISKRWTKEEELKLGQTAIEFKKNGLSKEEAFKVLAIQFGRTASAVSRKYYDMFPQNAQKNIQLVQVSEIANDKEQEVVGATNESNVIPIKKKVGRKQQFYWTNENIEILKNEILKKEKNNGNIEEFNLELVKQLKISRASVFNKLRNLKIITKTNTLLELYQSLSVGYDLDKLNVIPVVTKLKSSKTKQSKKSKKQNKKTHKETKAIGVIPQVVVTSEVVTSSEDVNKTHDVAKPNSVSVEPVKNVEKKKSIWQKLNPFYRIKQLEMEIEELKSKLT